MFLNLARPLGWSVHHGGSGVEAVCPSPPRLWCGGGALCASPVHIRHILDTVDGTE